MSSPLDRIEADARRDARLGVSLGPYSPSDVLALVAVARAAEGVMTQVGYETPHHTRLREALSLLGGAAGNEAA